MITYVAVDQVYSIFEGLAEEWELEVDSLHHSPVDGHTDMTVELVS